MLIRNVHICFGIAINEDIDETFLFGAKKEDSKVRTLRTMKTEIKGLQTGDMPYENVCVLNADALLGRVNWENDNVRGIPFACDDLDVVSTLACTSDGRTLARDGTAHGPRELSVGGTGIEGLSCE